jgi:hypothetical protein
VVVTAGGGGAVTVTDAVPDLVGAATEVAVTTRVPGVAGAVSTPEEVMVPADTVQVTAVFVAPRTVPVKIKVPPEVTLAVAGDTDTLTVCGGGCGVVEDPPPPQASRKIGARSTVRRILTSTETSR